MQAPRGRERSGSRPSRVLLPEMDPRYPLDRRLGGPQGQSGHKRTEEKSFGSAGHRNLVVQSVVRHNTD
jgi:hypothetical protein